MTGNWKRLAKFRRIHYNKGQAENSVVYWIVIGVCNWKEK